MPCLARPPYTIPALVVGNVFDNDSHTYRLSTIYNVANWGCEKPREATWLIDRNQEAIRYSCGLRPKTVCRCFDFPPNKIRSIFTRCLLPECIHLFPPSHPLRLCSCPHLRLQSSWPFRRLIGRRWRCAEVPDTSYIRRWLVLESPRQSLNFFFRCRRTSHVFDPAR